MKENIKKLYKPFILIFLISFLIINWNNISYIFNYRAIYGKLSLLRGKSFETEVKATNENYSDEENSIEVAKIGVKAPIVLAEEGKEENFKEALDRGVLLYPNSLLPGQKGTIIILGHSAPIGWPDINYDRIFSRLNELNGGDEIYIYFNQKRYFYRIEKKFFLKKGETIPSLTSSKSMLVLLSCWPPGKNQERIAVQAELVNIN